jgi:hypothetical protein
VTDLIGNRIREIDDRIRDLRGLRKDLAGLAETAAAFDPAECSPESVCRILNGPS